MIVVDSSAFVKFLLREKGWEEVVEYLKPEMEPCAVDYLLVESTNAIWKYCKLYRVIKDEQALKLFEYMIGLFKEGVIKLEAASKYLGDALNIALKYRISIYDAIFIVLAKTHDATLVTSDNLQEKMARELGIKTIFIL